MNKFLFLLIFVLGCNRAPTEQQVYEVAIKIESFKKVCSRVAASLGCLGELKTEYDRETISLYCNIYNPKNKNNPVTSFGPGDLLVVGRYLNAKESIK